MNSNKIIVKIVILISFLFCQFCQEKPESYDFLMFIENGLTNDNNKKFLTYINVHGSDYSGLKMTCILYSKELSPYFDNPKVDILFLIDAPESDSLKLKEYLKVWCFDNYIITYTTPEFFKPHKQQNVKGISYMFDRHGNEISLTNPSMSNFHKLMTE